MIDISEKEVLIQYLRERGLLKKESLASVHYCQGGVSCTVAYVEIDGKPMIIKQALGQLKTKETWLCDPNRMYIEYESNKIYHELLPENAPETYFYDQGNYIYGREAVPDGCRMWKDDLMEGILNKNIARKAVDTLITVHNHCRNDKDIEKKFEDKSIFYSLRIAPYIEFTVSKHPEIEDHARFVKNQMMESKITLVHGDYSPKNIMLDGTGMKVLDYEVAHYGHPAFDLAFFSNHFILKAVKFTENAEKYLDLLDEIATRYLEAQQCMDRQKFEEIYVQTLAILMLARVDGKSPVEYLEDEEDKQELVRSLSISIIKQKMSAYHEVAALLKESLEKEIAG